MQARTATYSCMMEYVGVTGPPGRRLTSLSEAAFQEAAPTEHEGKVWHDAASVTAPSKPARHTPLHRSYMAPPLLVALLRQGFDRLTVRHLRCFPHLTRGRQMVLAALAASPWTPTHRADAPRNAARLAFHRARPLAP
jgi:hypothetical protein